MDIRTPSDLIHVIRECGLSSPEQFRHAEAAISGISDLSACAEPLFQIGLLTRYQCLKIRAGRLEDLLFGPYLLLERIGEGGMGKVYRAVQHPVGRIVAIKMVRPQLLTNRMVISRYKREARAAAKLDHPNIVRLYDADEINGRYFLAMEYVDGIDLSRMVKQFGNPPHQGLADYHEAAEYIRQAALGLQHAHEHGLVHRDIKPSNLLVFGERPLFGTSAKATVKILDMGLVRSILEPDDPTCTELTRDGTVVGTPDYMSPEQAKNSSTVDPRADLYSLGCTLYFLLRGQPPFPVGTPVEKLMRHQLDPPPNLREARPDLPEGLVQIVERLLKKKPAERYSCANDVAVALVPFTPQGSVNGVERGTGEADSTGRSPVPLVSLEPEPVPTHLETPAGSLPVTAQPESSTPGRGTATSRSPATQRPAPAPITAPSSPLPESGRMPASSALPNRASGPSSKATTPLSGPVSVRVRPAVVSAPQQNEIVEAEVVRIENPGSSSSPAGQTGRHRLPASRATASERHRKPSTETVPDHRHQRILYGAAAFFVVSIIFLIAALIYRSSRNSSDISPPDSLQPPPTPTSAGEYVPPAPLPIYANLASPRQVIPAEADAVMMIFPQPYWQRARTELPSSSRLKNLLQQLTEQTQFDPQIMDRLTVCWMQGGQHILAVGEGEFLTPEWVKKLDGLPSLPLPSPPGATRRIRLFSAKNPWAGLATTTALIGNTGYAIADERDILLAYARQLLLLGTRAPVANSELLVQMPSPSDPSRPLATFVAMESWKLPSGKTLKEFGIRQAVLKIHLGSEFDLELLLDGSDKAAVESFLEIELGQEFPKWKPVIIGFRQTPRRTSLPKSTGWETRTSTRVAWGPFHTMVDNFIP